MCRVSINNHSKRKSFAKIDMHCTLTANCNYILESLKNISVNRIVFKCWRHDIVDKNQKGTYKMQKTLIFETIEKKNVLNNSIKTGK